MKRSNTGLLAEFANKHLDEGHAKGLADAVLALLDDRKVQLSADTRSRIAECRDETQLLAWLLRAASAATAEGLFA